MDQELARMRLISNRLIDETPMAFHRRLYRSVDWENRLVCIKGPRGTGKTTMLRQSAKERFGLDPRAIYVSFDHYWFKTHSPLEFAEEMHKQGVTHLFVDEVHHVEHWQTAIKNFTDFYPEMSVVYSGSSLLKMDNREGDLSRRQIAYTLDGLSFREFLAYEGALDAEPVPLEAVLADHVRLAADVARKIRVLPLFERYLATGFYPFYKTEHSGYYERVAATVDKVLDSDWPAVEDVTPATIRKTKKMLAVLAASCPQQPNMSALYRELETDRNQGLKMLSVLERAGLLALVPSGKDSLKNLSRPEKIFCANPNLMHALVSRADEGTIRETFFVNQLRAAGHAVVCADRGDFTVDGRYRVEVGGRKKGFAQIKDSPESFAAADDLEAGFGNRIPLWLFGFLH
jgi:predicted AAA+ superfamily ATPase